MLCDAVVGEMVGFTRGEAARCGAVVSAQLASDLPAVLADRVELQQVLLNLIINALEAMEVMQTGERRLLMAVVSGSLLTGLAPSRASPLPHWVLRCSRILWRTQNLWEPACSRRGIHAIPSTWVETYRPLQLASSAPKI